ncbi:MAG: CAP domain-containing protein [Firmicutes bacterium]|nr:CAP domain-containing protein [Bacillota bacterium]
MRRKITAAALGVLAAASVCAAPSFAADISAFTPAALSDYSVSGLCAFNFSYFSDVIESAVENCFSGIYSSALDVDSLIGNIGANAAVTTEEDALADDVLTDDALADDVLADDVLTEDGAEYGSKALEILELVNAEREAAGLDSLSLDPTLTEMAQYKAEDMSAYGFSHEGSYGSFKDLLKKFGVSYSAAGENIARGQANSKQVMESWMASEGHRANILGESYTKIGVGFYDDGEDTYWVQEFAG